MKKIQSKIIESKPVAWRSLEFIQPPGFKDLTTDAYERLRASMIENNFVESFKVWQDNGTLYCLDGYHRCRLLALLAEEGFEIPETFPADFIDCADRKEAASLVLVYSSIYARVHEEGLYELMSKEGLEWDKTIGMIDIPHINLAKYEQFYMPEYSPDQIQVPITDEDIENEKKRQFGEGISQPTTMTCPKCGHDFEVQL